MSQSVHDPRNGLNHSIKEGQVYGDARHKTEEDDGTFSFDEQLRLVYRDDERVMLRSDSKHTRGAHSGKHIYVSEARDEFEKNVGSGRYKLLTEPDDPPKMPTDGIATTLTVLKRLREQERHQVSVGGGRKNEHRLEAFEEAVEAVAAIDPTNIDWETVDGIGAKTAENLNENGFETDVDVQAASDEQLLNISGVGSKSLKNLREAAES